MATTVTGHLSDADMAKLATDKAAMAKLGTTEPPPPAKFVFLAAFDGSNNDKGERSAFDNYLKAVPDSLPPLGDERVKL
jgi:hypothetical protein